MRSCRARDLDELLTFLTRLAVDPPLQRERLERQLRESGIIAEPQEDDAAYHLRMTTSPVAREAAVADHAREFEAWLRRAGDAPARDDTPFSSVAIASEGVVAAAAEGRAAVLRHALAVAEAQRLGIRFELGRPVFRHSVDLDRSVTVTVEFPILWHRQVPTK